MAEASVTSTIGAYEQMRVHYPHLLKTGYKCDCGSSDVQYDIWESSCGGYEDYHYFCFRCGKNWWIDGIDS